MHPTLRKLRMALALGGARVAAWVVLQGKEERCRYALGLEPYAGEASLGPWADVSSGWSEMSIAQAKERWPEHPLVGHAGLSGTLFAYVLDRSLERRLVLCVVAAKAELAEEERCVLEDVAKLLAMESVGEASRAEWMVPREGRTLVVSDDPGEEGGRLLAARFKTLVDSLDAGILVEDESDFVRQCNLPFCQLVGCDDLPEQLVGRSSHDVLEQISPAFFIPEALVEGVEELKTAGKVVKDELVYLADMRILERSYSPLELDRRLVGHLWTYRDVTDRERNKDLLQRQADELRALSLVDELTGLYNRRGFLTLATQQLKLCDRSLRAALIVFVDLDGMKRINDELGHEYGDEALVETANVLRQSFRYSDVIARLGGDEFVILAVEADPPAVDVVTERLYERLAENNAKPGRKFQLSFSVGIAPYDPSKLEMVEEVLARADGLMYEQKRLRKAARAG